MPKRRLSPWARKAVAVARVSRLKVVGVVALGALVFGCSGGGAGEGSQAAMSSSEPSSSEPSSSSELEADAVPAVDREGLPELGEFEVALTGEPIPMTAWAELKVREGVRYVHVAITGSTPSDDVMTIDLTFDGLENVIGTHRVDFGLPDTGAHIANGSLDGTWYYSQAGDIDVSVSPEGLVTGDFEILLAEGEETPLSEGFGFEPRSVTTPLVGTFNLPWTLNCYSRLAGHSSFVFGGEYCENLDL